MRPLRSFVAALAALLCAAGASAHLMPAGQGGMRFDEAGVFALVALPVRAFHGVPADSEGRIDAAQFEAARDALQQQAAALLEFRGDDKAGRMLVNQLMFPAAHDRDNNPRADYLIAMQRVVWEQPPQAVTLRAHQFEHGVAAPLLLKAQRGDDNEAVLLTGHYDEHRFFAGPWAAFARFVGVGAEHILLGADHLLFLLTVLVVGAGWRYWAAVVTSFTLAHSVTLTLSALGWVAVPASVAEPMIAASIVLMACINLRERAVHLARRSAIVFACGLVHGLGFARALGELGGTGSRWVQLAGFNLGVELGQLLFVAALLVLLAVAKRLWPLLTTPRIARATSWSAAGLGSALLLTLLVQLPS